MAHTIEGFCKIKENSKLLFFYKNIAKKIHNNKKELAGNFEEMK